jgi:hypothetical protein
MVTVTVTVTVTVMVTVSVKVTITVMVSVQYPQEPEGGLDMTKNEIDPSLILKDGDNIYFRGEKYQKVEEPKSFYDKVWELVSNKIGDNTDADELTDRIMDLIRGNIPEPLTKNCHLDIITGYNNAIVDINERF